MKIDIKESELLFETPKEYYDYLDKFVVGQEELKKTLSVTAFKHISFCDKASYKPSHLFVFGPSGTGKTYAVSKLLAHLDLSYVIFDASTVTTTGYVGATFDQAVTYLYNASGNNTSKTERGVIIFDEIDKLFSFSNSSNENLKMSSQNELLRLLEGNIVQVHTSIFDDSATFVNTSKILFIFLGSFNKFKDIIYKQEIGLYEEQTTTPHKVDMLKIQKKLVSCGLSNELIGRISYFTQTTTLKKEEIKKVLLSTSSPLIESYEKYFELYNIKLKLDDSFIEFIINSAEFANFGIRRITQELNFFLLEHMFNIKELNSKQYTLLKVSENNGKIIYDLL